MQNRFLEHIKDIKINNERLQEALAIFSSPKERTIQNFQEGIKQFIRLANMPPDEREGLYGSRFAGLYNNNHLAELWNEHCPDEDKIAPHSLDALKPESWEVIVEEDCLALQYVGPELTIALDQLLKGPTVIDCGMFCQLGIWFGIRHILGDDEFNKQFTNKPFFLTRFNYVDTVEEKEALGNPLFAFFSPDLLNSVKIEHLFNHPTYSIKHPGGNLAGENVLIIENDYYIFAPLHAQNQWTREEVENVLRNAYNAEPDSHDRDALDTFQDNQDFFESQYGSIYELPGVTISWVQILIDTPIFLQTYSTFLYTIPECKEAMEAIFGCSEQNCKTSFLHAFLTVAQNQEKFEAFYAVPSVKVAFKFMLEKNPFLLNQYFQDVLSVFTELHESMAEQTLSAEEFANMPKQSRPDLPICIHFDLNKFLLSLQHQGTAVDGLESVAFDDTPRVKKIKVLPSQVQATLFSGVSESDTTNTLDASSSSDMTFFN